MKKRYMKCIFLMLVLELLICATIASGASYFNQTDAFTDETTDTNPVATWYDYDENNFPYANVTSGNLFRANGSWAGIVDNTNVYFNFTADSYTYIEFDFRIDNSTCNFTSIQIVDSDGEELAYLNITGGDSKWATCDNNSAEIFNATITNNSWYTMKWDFNYTTNYARGRLYDSTDTLKNDSWFEVSNNAGALSFADFESFEIHTTTNEAVWLEIDNLKVYKAYDWGATGQTTNYILGSIIPLLFAVFLLIVVAGMALSGNVSIEGMIALMLACIIGMICLSVVYAI